MATGVLALALFAPVSAAGASPATATDPSGDTVTDTVEEPITALRADIVATSADVRPEGVVLGVRVGQTVDPKADPNWSSFDSTVTWMVDVTGDNQRDYKIEYSIDEETHGLTASLNRQGRAPRPPDGCDNPPASFNPASGYSVVVDPKCLGNPAALSYQVEVSYNTDIENDSADVATDLSPNEGWTGPVSLSGATPGASPSAQQVTPLEAPSTSSPQGSSLSAPSVPTPGPAAGAPASRPTSARPGPTAGAPRPAAQSGEHVDQTSASPGTALARTGSARTVQLAEFAAGIVLIGFGLMFATRRPAGATR
jgi:hypothetical protein